MLDCRPEGGRPEPVPPHEEAGGWGGCTLRGYCLPQDGSCVPAISVNGVVGPVNDEPSVEDSRVTS